MRRVFVIFLASILAGCGGGDMGGMDENMTDFFSQASEKPAPKVESAPQKVEGAAGPGGYCLIPDGYFIGKISDIPKPEPEKKQAAPAPALRAAPKPRPKAMARKARPAQQIFAKKVQEKQAIAESAALRIEKIGGGFSYCPASEKTCYFLVDKMK